MNLSSLGSRICILGPSGSGKSTLAAAIGRARDLPVIHLDQLRHLPGTQWELREDAEFAALHDAAIEGERWVIDGSYSQLLPKRLHRATGLILLDSSTPASLARYVHRTIAPRNRVGGLEGTTDRLRLGMLQYILGPTRSNRRRYREIFQSAPPPKVLLSSRRAIDRFYRRNDLRLR